MTFKEDFSRLYEVKILVFILTLNLVFGVLQKPLQFGSAPMASASDHSHSHEFSMVDIFEMIWIGNVEHEHHHESESEHTHPHHHSLQSGSSAIDVLVTSVHFFVPQTVQTWLGFLSTSPKDPYLIEILRPPIQT